MRILMVGPWRAVAMRRHIDWVVESGAEVCVADYWSRRDRVRPASFRLAYLSPRQSAALRGAKPNRRSQAAGLRAALRLRQIAAQFQPDLVHSYMLGPYTDACLRAGLRPLVVSAWGFLNRWLTGEATDSDRRWLLRLRAGAHTLLVESPNLERAMVQRRPAPLRVACFSIGVDGQLFHPDHRGKAAAWRFALNIPPEATVLLSPRGWSQVYGQRHIMQAVAQACHRLDQPLILVFLGMGRIKQPEALAVEVLEIGRRLGVGAMIRWVSEVPHDDMPGVYNLADIVLNYPSSDAFPATLLEAAACGRPMISSDLPAYRDTFIERCCTLVPPNDPAALADAITALVQAGPQVWAAQASLARQAVLAEHDEASQKGRLLALYARIVGAGSFNTQAASSDSASSAKSRH
jgi:glycosyltransferase involved in cell wall biosynthesis